MPDNDDSEELEALVRRLQSFANSWPETRTQELHDNERAIREAEPLVARKLAEHRDHVARLRK